MKLRELREQKKISQTEVAKIISTTQSNYSKYEQEAVEPNIETLIKLADYYNVTLDFLVGRQFTNDLGYLNDNEKELLYSFKKLTAINQIKIISEIKGILIAQN